MTVLKLAACRGESASTRAPSARRRPRNRLFAIGVAALIAVIVTAFLPWPAQALTSREEEEMSREFLRMVYAQYQVIEDPLIVDYVNDLGKRILTRMPPQPFPFRFYVIKEEVYNAFAGPAGHIFINSGLMAALDSEQELAGIIGHEICHVSSRHISQMIKRAQTANLASMAGVAAGILMGMSGAGTAGTAVTVGSVAAAQSAQLAYSRENEMQADQLALQYLSKAGYSGVGLLDSLKKIRSKTWYGTEQVPTYLLTHPAVEDRIAYIGTWVDSHEQNPWTTTPEASERFLMVRTRLSARYGEEDVTLEKFATGAEKNPEDFFMQFGYGIILARTGNRKDAIKHLQTALSFKPFDAHAVQELGRVYFLDGQYEKALKMLTSSSRTGVSDPETTLLLGRTQMELGNGGEAVTTIESLVHQRPDFTPAYYYLGEAYGKQNLRGNAHYYLGVYYSRRGDRKNAVFHLKTARDHLTDPALIREAERLLDDGTIAPDQKDRKKS